MNLPQGEPAGMLDERPPLVVHLIHRLDYGGMETVLVDLINNMGDTPYRHAVICLKDFTEFRDRIRSPAVDVIALRKREGKDFPHYAKVWRELRRLKPAIVNTYSIATLDLTLLARLSGARVVHAEHGWQLGRNDVDPKYIRMRRLMSPFISRFVAVSRDLANWLHETVGLAKHKVACIYNGVDPRIFPDSDRAVARIRVGVPANAYVVGTVGRLVPVKAQTLLVEAFARLQSLNEEKNVFLVIVGDGPEKNALERKVNELKLNESVLLAGARSDIPDWLASFDVFAVPSRNEGVSIAILEAMAAGLPVVATHVGGNSEVVEDRETGHLVPVGDVDAMAIALQRYRDDAALAARHGEAGRARMLAHFSMDSMITDYLNLYDGVLGRKLISST